MVAPRRAAGWRATRAGWVACLVAFALPPNSLRAQTNAFRPANLAEYGYIGVYDSRPPRQREDAQKLASPKGDKLDLTPTQSLLVEWTEPRDVRTVDLRFAGQVLRPEDVVIEWWRRVWPDNGKGGWMKLDDPFNGKWTAAKTLSAASPFELHLEMAPLDEEEAPGIKNTGADFRRTYKLRITSLLPAALAQLRVSSDAALKRARLRFEWDIHTSVPGRWSPQFEARNGRVLNTGRTGKNTAVVEVEYADAPDRLSNDRGRVMFRNGDLRGFAVFVDDVMREGGLFVRDIGAFVSDASRNLTYAGWKGPAGEIWAEGTVMEQTARLPEQSFDQIMRAIPEKPPRHCFLGVPNLRQEIALSPIGDIELHADSLRSPGPDANRRPWKWPELVLQLRTGEQPDFNAKNPRQAARSLEEGWLPVVRHEWQTGDIQYTETCVVSALLGDIASLQSQTGTEPVVLVARLQMKNTAHEARAAFVWLKPSHDQPWYLGIDGSMLLSQPSDGVDRPGLVPMRGRVNIFNRGDLDLAPVPMAALSLNAPPGVAAPKPPSAVRYRVELGPNESHAIELTAPYIELLNLEEARALKSAAFAPVHDSVVQFWKKRLSQGMSYEVPERFLNELFKANLWHVLISTDLDPQTGLAQHGAATHQYLNFLNETAMVARSLEMRGEHAEARKLIEPFLANQGVKTLPGNFRSKDGVFYAAHPGEPDPYTAQGYNMHHGWGLWAAAEHYAWTRDRRYLAAIADKLVKGCDWITRERQSTKFANPDGTRPGEYGLPPAGDLEDVEEYLYFYATSAYYYLGMREAASALAAIQHPQARRLDREAEEFLHDLEASVMEATATAPVVRLRDGNYIPYVPPRVYALTHRKEGWIREGLYPALHLLGAGVFPMNHPYANWMIQDLEDNIFMSAESGYGIGNPKANFFNYGGFTLQPNLLDLSIAYLRRDQAPNFLRAFYNTAWTSLYPDIACFAEWAPAFGKGDGPLYKTPDECRFIQWMRQMLILERGEALELGMGVPRAWMAHGKRIKITQAATYFGPLDLEITSQAARGEISAVVQINRIAFPKAIHLRLRHPDGKPLRSALVNGKPAPVNILRQTIELPLNTTRWEINALF